MKKRLSVISAISTLLIILIFIVLSNFSSSTVNSPSKKEGLLKVHFIDVGQADCILINTPSVAMLIDAGNNGDSKKVLSYIKSQGINKLDYVVGTHPDEDHIGSLDSCVDTFDIGKIIMPKVEKNTKTFESLLTSIKKKGLKVTTAKTGLKFDLDSKIKCEILSPSSDKYDDINDYSAVIKLTYGSTSFLFTGDAEKIPEKEMLDKGFNLKADVLKVGHHGSRTSTSEEFLKAVSPQHAVISVGKDNDYNHPHKETLDKLENIKTYRTDKDGTIVMSSYGDKITVVKEK